MTIPFIFVHMNLLKYMNAAYQLAQKAFDQDEVPVGALVISPQGDICGKGYNRTICDQDPTAHAEIYALRQAARTLGTHRLDKHTLVTTLEPCAMCAQAIAHARISLLIFGASDPKGGAVLHGSKVLEHTHHKVAFEHGLMAEPCGLILKKFFQQKRSKIVKPNTTI